MTGKTIKQIALITMIIDHFGCAIVYLMKQSDPRYKELYDVLRAIGRIAFPLYGFLVVEGFAYTKNLKKYIASMGLCALISEIPFNLTVSRGNFSDIKHQNVFLTIFITLLAMSLMEKILKSFGPGDVLRYDLMLLVMAVAALTGYLVKCDYRHGGVLMILFMYLARKTMVFTGIPARTYLLMMLLGCTVITLYSRNEIWAFADLIPVYFYNGKRGNIRHKYFYYLIYPAHLFVFGMTARYIKTIL